MVKRLDLELKSVWPLQSVALLEVSRSRLAPRSPLRRRPPRPRSWRSVARLASVHRLVAASALTPPRQVVAVSGGDWHPGKARPPEATRSEEVRCSHYR